MRVVTPPDTSRNVQCFTADGKCVIGFYWAAEKLWYADNGGKRRKDAINVVDWRELERNSSMTVTLIDYLLPTGLFLTAVVMFVVAVNIKIHEE